MTFPQFRSKKYTALFMVSAYSMLVEVFLNRYFAVANWSEYGYWIISIVMAGFAVSGVTMSVFENFFRKWRRQMLGFLPVILIIVSAIGFKLIFLNRFNPLEFQHEVLWKNQMLNILWYYLALFPVFFLCGIFIGLNFLDMFDELPAVYACNLIGSAFGAIAAVISMYLADPFHLLTFYSFPVLALAAVFCLDSVNEKKPHINLLTVLAILGLCSWWTGSGKFRFPDYKPVYSALNVGGNKIKGEICSPDGYYLLLENFTEHRNIDLSNNYSILKSSGPPLGIGVYRDGNKITTLPKAGPCSSYINASLDAWPYKLKPGASVLLIGTDGGFKIAEAMELGAGKITVLEPNKTVFRLVSENSKMDPGVKLLSGSPFAVLRNNAKFDLVDVSPDFLNESDFNRYIFTVDAVKVAVKHLSSDGMISIPVSIAELPFYADKVLVTAREALKQSGIADPGKQILVYRSAFTARIVICASSCFEKTIESLKKFCAERSFDISWFSGIKPDTINVWNDLPAVSFERQTVSSGDKPADAVMESAVRIFSNGQTDSFFNLKPATLNRPFFYSILPVLRIKTLISKLSLIPQQETGLLINIFVLAQALGIAILVIFLPMARTQSFAVFRKTFFRTAAYFACLGLGFLFIEITFIEKFTFFLNDSSTAFGAAIAGILVFSGLGSYAALKSKNAEKTVKSAVILLATMILLCLLFLNPVLLRLVTLPKIVKVIIGIILIAPASFAMGFPFSLGLSELKNKTGYLLPWAWAVNGSFSIIATPLANLFAVALGFNLLLTISGLLYLTALCTFPTEK